MQATPSNGGSGAELRPPAASRNADAGAANDSTAALARTLARIDARLDRLERSVSAIAGVVDQAMPALAMAGDILDEWAAKDGESDVDARVRGFLDLLETLTRPQTMEAAQVLARNAEKITAATKTLDQLVPSIAMFGDIFDEWATKDGHADFDARIRAGLRISSKLTEPETLAAAEALLDRMDRIGMAVETLDMVPHLVASITDVFDESVRKAAARGFDLNSFVGNAGKAASRFAELMTSPEFEALLSSGILDPDAVAIVGSSGRALAETKAAAPPKAGPLSALGSLRDPDVQRALGFLLAFARRFGQALAPAPPGQLPSGS